MKYQEAVAGSRNEQKVQKVVDSCQNEQELAAMSSFALLGFSDYFRLTLPISAPFCYFLLF
jgi:hypothetical protein